MTAEARFIQIHWLASYPGTLLNRDDAGLAKSLPFGGVMRTRISSQCLKRTWRKANDAMNIGLIDSMETGARSREHVERQVVNGLAEDTGQSADIVAAVGLAFIEALYGEKAKDRRSRQALLLGWPEIRFMRKEARALIIASADRRDAEVRCKEYFGKEGIRRVFRAVRAQSAPAAGFEAALFGRMITSDPEANIEAALHVAHAITVHRSEKDLDFLTVVDDLKGADDDAGAAGIFESELTSGLYYGYAVIDVPTLVSNLSGIPAKAWHTDNVDRTLPGEVASRLLHLIATVSPGAKKGSTAPYTYAELVLLEAGSRQPRTLSNAFRKPAELRGDLGKDALQSLSTYVTGLDHVYGQHEVRAGFCVGADSEYVESMGAAPKTLAELSDWIKSAIVSAQV
jgi:CRISPR system Cascade subunit CasC